MIRGLFLVYLLLQLLACQSVHKTGYGLQKNSGETLDLRDQNLVFGSQEEISSLYREKTKNKTDGKIIIKKSPFPKYPRADLDAGIEGVVVVEFIVNKKGKVIRPVVLKSSGDDFEKVSLACLKRWRFEPILKNGSPVDTRLRHSFQFIIKES